MSEKNEIESAIEAGKELNNGKLILKTDELKYFIVPEGYEIDSVTDHNERPDRKTGIRTFVSARSFCSYVNKHKNTEYTIIIADESKDVVRAILNDHGDGPEWGDFQADLKLEKSRQWRAWGALENKFMGQVEFYQFIEDNRPDFMCGGDDGNISAVGLTQLILDLEVTVNEKLESKFNPQTDERVYSYSNEQDGKGSFKLPKTFTLAIPIFKNGDIYQVTVNLRFRMDGGSARFGFLIDQKDELIEKAFDGVCDRITEGVVDKENKDKAYTGTEIEVYRGCL